MDEKTLNTELPFAFGLKNQGVNCFLNAVLQNILTLPTIRKEISQLCSSIKQTLDDNIKAISRIQPNEIKDLPTKDPNHQMETILLCELCRMSEHMPSKAELDKYKDKYKRTHDRLAEIMSALIDIVYIRVFGQARAAQQDSMQAMTYILGDTFERNAKIKSLYTFRRVKSIYCKYCQSAKLPTKDDQEFYINFSFSNKGQPGQENFLQMISYELSDLLYEPKEVKNENEAKDKIQCLDGCPQKNMAKKQCWKTMYLTEAPEILFVNVGRFGYSAGYPEKILEAIYRPDEILRLSFYDEQLRTTKFQFRYKLMSLIIHVSDRVDSGHYYCIARRYPDGWYELNDEKVTPIGAQLNLTDEILRNVYLLSYQKLTD